MLYFSIFVAGGDATIVNVALPTFARRLDGRVKHLDLAAAPVAGA
ncbi:hypothetical protein ACX9NE_18950 [Mycobacterium sp. ML4]